MFNIKKSCSIIHYLLYMQEINISLNTKYFNKKNDLFIAKHMKILDNFK